MAIKIEELRIGNLLKWKSSISEGFSKVSFIENRLQSTTIFNSPSFQLESGATGNECEPIKLTEDLFLSKLVFDKKGKWFTNGLFEISLDEEGAHLRLIHGNVSKYLKHIQYIHQLQNLHFELTGDELIIKP